MRLSSNISKALYGVVILAALAPSMAAARVTINSQCYMNVDDSQKQIVGTATEKEFELASVSKMVTTFWAINKLGPNYRYQNKIHVTPLAGDTYDVHLEGDKDPYMGQEFIYFLVSELNKLGVTKIERLSFDENFDIFWSVRESKSQAARSFDPSIAQVATTLESVLMRNKFFPTQYQETRRLAKSKFNLEMLPSANVQIRKVEPLTKERFLNSKTNETKTFVMNSAPLHRYLKEMNLYSNNYVADLIFARLGGVDEFHKFIKSRLELDLSDIKFVNGSGDSEYAEHGKLYNKGSCSSLMKILFAMREDLAKHGLDLPDVMAVSGAENSTLGGRYAGLPNTVVAKTGSVNPAITLSGMIATEKGNLIFAVLMKTDGPADWTAARNKIRGEVNSIIAKNGGAAQVKYTPKTFLPFDSKSGLQLEVMTSKN
ncbi:MAG: D-alanyl-D-alanine carboxypeptidase [Bdellovibrionia bacterium]